MAGGGAADRGLAATLRGFGLILRGGAGGGGAACSIATTGLGTSVGGGVLNSEPSGWLTVSGTVWVT